MPCGIVIFFANAKSYIIFAQEQTRAIWTRFKRRSFGAFRLSALGGGQPACDRRAENHLKYHPIEVRRSFAGAELRRGEAQSAGNTSVFSRAATKYRHNPARQNRARIAPVCFNCAKRNITRRKPNKTAKQYNSPQANITEGRTAK